MRRTIRCIAVLIRLIRFSVSGSALEQTKFELGKRRGIGPPKFIDLSVDLLASGFE